MTECFWKFWSKSACGNVVDTSCQTIAAWSTKLPVVVHCVWVPIQHNRRYGETGWIDPFTKVIELQLVAKDFSDS